MDEYIGFNLNHTGSIYGNGEGCGSLNGSGVKGWDNGDGNGNGNNRHEIYTWSEGDGENSRIRHGIISYR